MVPEVFVQLEVFWYFPTKGSQKAANVQTICRGSRLRRDDGHVSQCLEGDGRREGVALDEDYTAEKESHHKLVRSGKRGLITAQKENT